MKSGREEYIENRLFADWEYRLCEFGKNDVGTLDEFNVRQLAVMCKCSVPTIYKALGSGNKVRYTAQEFLATVDSYLQNYKQKADIRQALPEPEVAKYTVEQRMQNYEQLGDKLAELYNANRKRNEGVLVLCPICGTEFRKRTKTHSACSKRCSNLTHNYISPHTYWRNRDE